MKRERDTAHCGDDCEERMDRLSPSELRRRFRSGCEVSTTAGLAKGYVQMSLTVLPEAEVSSFVAFAEANHRAVPVLKVLPKGASVPTSVAAGADLRTDLSGYRVFRDGRVHEQRTEVASMWRDDLVCVLAGCSYTFDEALEAAGIRLAHVAAGTSPAIYRTSRACVPHGAFAAPLVVTMRLIPEDQVAEAVVATARYPDFHGKPIHIGDPMELGIADLTDVAFGDVPDPAPGCVPVFWACNVTRHDALLEAGVSFAITNAPSQMFVSDVLRTDVQRAAPVSDPPATDVR